MPANRPLQHLFTFLTGNAGTGKTYQVKKAVQEDKKFGLLCATTGIAAVNLSGAAENEVVTTVNSALKYGDLESLEDNYAAGRLHRQLKQISAKHRRLVIDECSMMSAEQLNIITKAVQEINKLEEVQVRGGFGILLTGDFCQLPPINGNYAFKSQYWKEYAANMRRLTKTYRQTDKQYIEALNWARKGEGDKVAEILGADSQVTWNHSISTSFEGTTLFATNKEVDRFNEVHLQRLVQAGNKIVTLPSIRWGMQKPEWRNIPEELVLADNGYVMILSNHTPDFMWVNGDCGWVRDVHVGRKVVTVELARNKQQVMIGMVNRKYLERDTPAGKTKPRYCNMRQYKEWLESETEEVVNSTTFPILYRQYLREMTEESKKERVASSEPYFDYEQGKWVMGEIWYSPLRFAYATSVHKSQGLSLDRLQIDYQHKFFGEPAMSYVALSRCKTPAGLTIVGSPGLVERRTNVSREVLEWL